MMIRLSDFVLKEIYYQVFKLNDVKFYKILIKKMVLDNRMLNIKNTNFINMYF